MERRQLRREFRFNVVKLVRERGGFGGEGARDVGLDDEQVGEGLAADPQHAIPGLVQMNLGPNEAGATGDREAAT